MARMPRLVVAGQAHLVIQRSTAARPGFIDDEDRRLYAQAMVTSARACSVSIHAYVLLENEARLLVTPDAGDALGRFMQRLARSYVPACNGRHGKQGKLWADRFQATVLDPELFLLRAVRFIEQAPVKAGVVLAAEEWPWSSAAHHVGRCANPAVSTHPAYWRLGNTPFEREVRYGAELRKLLTEAQVAEILNAARAGWPLGSTAFLNALGQVTQRALQPRPCGRPRRIDRDIGSTKLTVSPFDLQSPISDY